MAKNTLRKRSNLSKKDFDILKKVSKQMKYPLKDLINVYGLESDFGFNQGKKDSKYKGPFQFDNNTAKEIGLKNIFDLKESAVGFVNLARKRRSSLKNNLVSVIGDEDKANKWIKSHDQSTIDYLLHQQGGKGVARIALGGMDSETSFIKGRGNQDLYYEKSRDFMMSNLTSSQQEEFVRTKTRGEAVEYYIGKQSENLKLSGGLKYTLESEDIAMESMLREERPMI